MRVLCSPAAVVLGAGLLLLAACTEPSPGGAAADEAAASSDDAATPDTLTVARTDTVRVKLSEFRIDMATSLRAGPTVFRVRNAGQRRHNFRIEGQGVEHMFGSALEPGRTRSMKMDLQSGTYEIHCPIEEHAGRGMALTLTVEGSDTSA